MLLCEGVEVLDEKFPKFIFYFFLWNFEIWCQLNEENVSFCDFSCVYVRVRVRVPVPACTCMYGII